MQLAMLPTSRELQPEHIKETNTTESLLMQIWFSSAITYPTIVVAIQSITDGIKYIYDYAESVGKPCVINMSLGYHIGPHDGTSTFDRICDELQGEGRLFGRSFGK